MKEKPAAAPAGIIQSKLQLTEEQQRLTISTCLFTFEDTNPYILQSIILRGPQEQVRREFTVSDEKA